MDRFEFHAEDAEYAEICVQSFTLRSPRSLREAFSNPIATG